VGGGMAGHVRTSGPVTIPDRSVTKASGGGGGLSQRRECVTLWREQVCCSVLQRDAACCSVLQCVAVCCSVLQCVAVIL